MKLITHERQLKEKTYYKVNGEIVYLTCAFAHYYLMDTPEGEIHIYDPFERGLWFELEVWEAVAETI